MATGKLHPSKMRATIILSKANWKALRLQGFEDQTSASSIVEEILTAYLDESSGVKKAVERWKKKA